MLARTVELLVYAKALYRRGSEECNPNTEIANMIAVLHFHDALEFCVRAVIEEEQVTHSSGDTLINLIAAVDRHHKNTGKRMPLASQINGLNTTRNNAKHHATPPHESAVQNGRVHTLAFLENVCTDYFSIDFSSISQVMLVKNADIRQLLNVAENHLAASDFLEALIAIKKAFLKSKPSDNHYIDRRSPSFSSSLNLYLTTSHYRDASDHHHGNITSLGKAVEDTDKKVRALEVEIGELRSQIVSMMMGIDVKRLETFMNTTPQFIFHARQTYEILWKENIVPTREMVESNLEFALAMILEWEKAGVLGEGHGPFNHRQIPHDTWSIVREEQRDKDW